MEPLRRERHVTSDASTRTEGACRVEPAPSDTTLKLLLPALTMKFPPPSPAFRLIIVARLASVPS